MTRAYISSYKRAYSVSREWYQAKPLRIGDTKNVSYELEIERVCELAEHIKNYKAPAKVRDGHTKHTAAVALAIKSYYMRFLQYDATILMRLKGVSFDEVKVRRGGVVFRKLVRYSRLLDMDRLLRANNWNPQDALKQWVREANENYDKYMSNGNLKALDRNMKRPTPAMMLGMYARLIRHSAAQSLIHTESIDAIEENWDDDDLPGYGEHPLLNARTGVVSLYDIGYRYNSLTKEVSQISRSKRKDEFY